MKTATEIRDYFLSTLNEALPRLGMFGGEVAARQLLTDLAFIDDREHQLSDELDVLRARGASTASGVGGAFNQRTGLRATDNEIGSVYANIAFLMGYLRTERILTATEFASLESELCGCCSTSDLNADDVRAQFGAPSWQSGTNPYDSWVFLYLCRDCDYPIAVGFWNVLLYDKENGLVSGEYGDVPVLRNVRLGASDFGSEFTFTPIGRTIAAKT